MHKIHQLGYNTDYYVNAENREQAMKQMLDFLNIENKDENASIYFTKSGLHYVLDHHGETYVYAGEQPLMSRGCV